MCETVEPLGNLQAKDVILPTSLHTLAMYVFANYTLHLMILQSVFCSQVCVYKDILLAIYYGLYSTIIFPLYSGTSSGLHYRMCVLSHPTGSYVCICAVSVRKLIQLYTSFPVSFLLPLHNPSFPLHPCPLLIVAMTSRKQQRATSHHLERCHHPPFCLYVKTHVHILKNVGSYQVEIYVVIVCR